MNITELAISKGLGGSDSGLANNEVNENTYAIGRSAERAVIGADHQIALIIYFDLRNRIQ